MESTLFVGPPAGLTLHCLKGSVLSLAGFLHAWLGCGLRDQVLACVGALLEKLEPDKRCTILLTGKQLNFQYQLLPSLCELAGTPHLS